MKCSRQWLSKLFLFILLLSAMGTSCVRTVFSIREYSLGRCSDSDNSLSLLSDDTMDAGWKLEPVRSRAECPGLNWYRLSASTRDLPERLREIFVAASVERTQKGCTLKLVVEGLCGKNQSLDDCKKALPYQKDGVGLVSASDFFQERFLKLMVARSPVLKGGQTDKSIARFQEGGCP